MVGGSVEPFHEVAETCVRLFVRLLVDVDENRHGSLMFGLVGRPVWYLSSAGKLREEEGGAVVVQEHSWSCSLTSIFLSRLRAAMVGMRSL